ncbi:MAG TPA: hypothetical protein V6C58_03185 [Allocoleopsis sp.]
MNLDDLFNKCSTVNNNKIVVVEENQRKFIINNAQGKTIRKVLVDGCLIDDHRQRCDYLFEIDDPCTLAIYVELKGKDIEKAFNQLIATLDYLSQKHKNCHKECYIIASKVPKAGPQVQVLKTKLAKSHKVQLFVFTGEYKKNI